MHRLFRSFVGGLLVAILMQAPAVNAAPAAASVPALGVITQAQRANVGDSTAATGSTIFDGDLLQTEQDGSLRVRIGSSQAYLFNKGAAVFHQLAGGFSLDLSRGGVILSSGTGQTFHLVADGATVQPSTTQPTVAQVDWVSAKELVVTSRKGALQVSMGDQTQTVADGSSYRMVIDPAAAAAAGSPAAPQAQTGGKNFAMYILIGGALVLTGVGLGLAFESPSAL